VLLFYSLHGKNAEWYTYSVMFKMIWKKIKKYFKTYLIMFL
jgi:hypothetical protein